jgi:hypothetical protein
MDFWASAANRPCGVCLRPAWVVLFACLMMLTSHSAGADTFKIENPGQGFATIEGKWQFHTGDNMAWARPGYDDSTWEQLSGGTSWGAQSHPGYTGFAWYRRQIEVGGNGQPLAILIPPVNDAYEIYWNGRKIGNYGHLPPHADWWARGHSAVYPLESAPASGVLAVRAWKATLTSLDPETLGGFGAAPELGDPLLLGLHAAHPGFENDERSLPRILIATVLMVIGLLTLLLFLRDRRQRLYLWLGIYLFADGVHGFRRLSVFAYGLNLIYDQVIAQFIGAFQDISLWLLLLSLFGLSNDRRWRRWTVALAVLYLSAQAVDITTIFFWQNAGLGMQWVDAITTAIYDVTPLYIFFIVTFGLARRKQPALWPVAAAAFLYGLYGLFLGLVGQGTRFTHWTISDTVQSWGVSLGGYRFDISFVLDVSLFLVLLFTVARQQFLERHRQEQIELEVRSAREVQHVLIPEAVAAIPGFAIASVYKPAAELGGDFFQVMEQDDGSALIVLGDVSGKGLKAAMTVSFIVGVIRTLIQYTTQPAEILRGLNQRLFGRSEGGFTTCLLLQITVEGEATLANAGHLAPFRDGQELPVAGSLPLGLTEDVVYDELIFRLQVGEKLTLYTDGVLEARNAKGELYGFDRLAELLRRKPSVEEIVETACSFGQQDDITVLSIARTAASQAHTARLDLTTQIAGS